MRTITQVFPALRRHERLLNATRTTISSARATGRTLRGGNRPLPNFLIIGAQRGGTTSLHEDLCKHELVAKPLSKEVQFFTLNHEHGERWYRSHFPRLEPGQQTFESSPYYLFHPAAPARVAAMLPDAKFLVLLRDPVARAYSHYLHSCAVGVEQLSFDEAIDAEETRLTQAESLGLDSPEGVRIHRNFSYKSRGMYSEQLSRWFSHVPRSQLLILKSEDWFRNPGDVYIDVLRFLSLPQFAPQKWARSNILASNSASAGMSQETRDKLHQHFESDSEQVRRLLGWETAWA